jgi:hypothetical protein
MGLEELPSSALMKRLAFFDSNILARGSAA